MKVSKLNGILIDSIIGTIILSSGAVFGYMNLKLIWIVQAIISICIIILNRNQLSVSRRKSIKSFMILFGFLINLILIAQSDSAMFGSMMISLFACYTLSCVCTGEKFAQRYICMITIIAAFSLIQYVLSQLGIFLGGKIVYASGSTYFVSMFYHVYRSWSTSMIVAAIRNSGIFWEPGAYQMFLNMALLFLMKTEVKGKIAISAILIISLLTTRSTTGYIIFVLLGCLLFVQKNEITAKRLIVLFIGVAILIGVITSPIVIEKLTLTNDSTSVRINDVIGSLQICLQRPIFGFGYNNPQISYELSRLGVKYNSVGLLSFAMMFGVPFSIFSFLEIWNNISFISKQRKKSCKILILLMLLIIHMTEHFMVKEIFLIFMFSFRNLEVYSDERG